MWFGWSIPGTERWKVQYPVRDKKINKNSSSCFLRFFFSAPFSFIWTFSCLCCYFPVLLNLNPTLSSFSQNRVSFENLYSPDCFSTYEPLAWQCSCPHPKNFTLTLFPMLDHCSHTSMPLSGFPYSPGHQRSPFAFASLCIKTDTMWVSQRSGLSLSNKQRFWRKHCLFVLFRFSVLLCKLVLFFIFIFLKEWRPVKDLMY